MYLNEMRIMKIMSFLVLEPCLEIVPNESKLCLFRIVSQGQGVHYLYYMGHFAQHSPRLTRVAYQEIEFISQTGCKIPRST